MEKPRLLKASEMDVRIATISEKGASLLIYKDARVDMDILDEWVGSMNWKRKHSRDNANCCVSIYDRIKNEWITKEDTGTESFTEKEKGLASDSFKRACFNWGIGRELYTAPFIWIKPLSENEFYKNQSGKYSTNTKFVVDSVTYDNDRNIINLVIKDNKGNVRFGKATNAADPKNQEPQSTKLPDDLIDLLTRVETCETLEQLKEIYQSEEKYKSDKRFISEINKKKAILTPKN